MSIQMGEVLAFIPARGSSKGLPRKNCRLLAGKPLLAWSVEAALKARLITRVIVSTEDEELAAIARAHGAEVPFLRPGDMARDDSLIGDALQYTLKRLKDEEGYTPECVLELYPTHPFRTSALLDFLALKLLEGCNEVVTMRELDCGLRNLVVQDAQGGLSLLGDRADAPDSEAEGCGRLYRRYGQCYGWRLTNPIELVDIDYLADFLLAEQIIAQNLYEFA
jgi:CMP-N,N'-diacetyllegionaminic acid synthase